MLEIIRQWLVDLLAVSRFITSS